MKNPSENLELYFEIQKSNLLQKVRDFSKNRDEIRKSQSIALEIVNFLHLNKISVADFANQIEIPEWKAVQLLNGQTKFEESILQRIKQNFKLKL